ncbi:hypothetical protein BC829DRAFT_441989 [Chytridium lagenaria]|nr:hypothetical protein BC829DRAFT_441989 [Chytridium lagenaria]
MSTRLSPGDWGVKVSLPSCYGWNLTLSLPHKPAQGNLTITCLQHQSAAWGSSEAPIAAFCLKQLDCGFTRWPWVEGWAAIQEGVKGDHGEAKLSPNMFPSLFPSHPLYPCVGFALPDVFPEECHMVFSNHGSAMAFHPTAANQFGTNSAQEVALSRRLGPFTVDEVRQFPVFSNAPVGAVQKEGAPEGMVRFVHDFLFPRSGLILSENALTSRDYLGPCFLDRVNALLQMVAALPGRLCLADGQCQGCVLAISTPELEQL